MKFKDIPQFPKACYSIDLEWRYLETTLNDTDVPLVIEPDYQRGHVWTDEQRTAYVEYGLMGGENSRVIVTNCPGWMGDFRGPYEVVDGLQRITAVRKFMNNEIKAFGHYYKDFEDSLIKLRPSFIWRVCNLSTRTEVLKLYLALNSGGVVHSAEEIERVRKLLTNEVENRKS